MTALIIMMMTLCRHGLSAVMCGEAEMGGFLHSDFMLRTRCGKPAADVTRVSVPSRRFPYSYVRGMLPVERGYTYEKWD